MATAKKPVGRPCKQQPQEAKQYSTPQVDTVDKRAAFEEDIYKKVPREHEIISGGGILPLRVRASTALDNKRGAVVQIRYCESENSIYMTSRAKTLCLLWCLRTRTICTPNQAQLSRLPDKHPFNEANGGNVF